MSQPTHLRSVSDADDMHEDQAGALPAFEGQSVHSARLKLTSASDLDVNDAVSHIDDVVRLFVEGRVVRIDHVVDERTGNLKRVHTIKVVDAVELPWDFDTGAFDG